METYLDYKMFANVITLIVVIRLAARSLGLPVAFDTCSPRGRQYCQTKYISVSLDLPLNLAKTSFRDVTRRKCHYKNRPIKEIASMYKNINTLRYV